MPAIGIIAFQLSNVAGWVGFGVAYGYCPPENLAQGIDPLVCRNGGFRLRISYQELNVLVFQLLERFVSVLLTYRVEVSLAGDFRKASLQKASSVKS